MEHQLITGVGVLTATGQGFESFWQKALSAESHFQPITLFETDKFLVNKGAEISDFDPKVYMGKKKLRSLDRSTKLAVSAAKVALENAQVEITDNTAEDIGVVFGCTCGSLQSIYDFDQTTIMDGPRYTNPALFPNTVFNSPASQISIWTGVKGFNTTVSTGFTSGLNAVDYGLDFLKQGRVQALLAGAVEEMCYPTYYTLYQLKQLSGIDGEDTYFSGPFDRKRNGVTFGEGAAILMIENEDYAQKHGRSSKVKVAGAAQYFLPYRFHKFHPSGQGMVKAMQMALDNANLKPEDVDVIIANANSTASADLLEAKAIGEVFKGVKQKPHITAPKSWTGETINLSGTLALVVGYGVLQTEQIPPTIGLDDLDPEIDLESIVREKVSCPSAQHVLVNCFGHNGAYASAVLSRHAD